MRKEKTRKNYLKLQYNMNGRTIIDIVSFGVEFEWDDDMRRTPKRMTLES